MKTARRLLAGPPCLGPARQDGPPESGVVGKCSSALQRGDVPALLERIDEDFLPGIDLEDGGVTFTVVLARSAESFESAART